MSRSVRSVVVGDQGSCEWLGGGAVVPDRGGERQNPLDDSGGPRPNGCVYRGVQVKPAVEGVVDRLDQLPEGASSSWPGGARGCGRRGQQVRAAGAQVRVEFSGNVARQWIKTVFDTLRGQLTLEAHGRRTLAGVSARVAAQTAHS